jgi:hypothetical protein
VCVCVCMYSCIYQQQCRHADSSPLLVQHLDALAGTLGILSDDGTAVFLLCAGKHSRSALVRRCSTRCRTWRTGHEEAMQDLPYKDTDHRSLRRTAVQGCSRGERGGHWEFIVVISILQGIGCILGSRLVGVKEGGREGEGRGVGA